MQQHWYDLLFMHWPVEKSAIEPMLPIALAPYLDLFDGMAWLSVVPFRVAGLHLRAVPPLPGLSRFPEVNVRTYLTLDNKPGVYFFSLDAGNRAAAYAARTAVGLNYFHAEIAMEPGDGYVEFRSRRQEPPGPADFIARYGPKSAVESHPHRGTLDYFLTERYCLYAMSGKNVSRLDIHHRPWSLKPAWCEATVNTLAEADGISLPAAEPRLQFASSQNVLFWWPQTVRENA
jgi:uncharacterized protein YqjF (DUF2071 family)